MPAKMRVPVWPQRRAVGRACGSAAPDGRRSLHRARERANLPYGEECQEPGERTRSQHTRVLIGRLPRARSARFSAVHARWLSARSSG